MKLFKKSAILLFALLLIMSSFVFSASAAKSAVLYFSKNTVEVGDKVTVTVSVNPNEAMYGVQFYLEYDDEVLKYQSGSAGSAKAGVLEVVESPAGDKSVKYNFTFTAIKVGSSAITVKDCVYGALGSAGSVEKSFGGASAKLTVKDVALSNNANLKSLKVSGYSLSPNFSASKTSYTLKVPYETTKINISATTADKNAKVTGVSGNSGLKVGKNAVTVTVQAQNGTQKVYTINVTRLEENTTSTDQEVEESTSTDIETSIGGTNHIILTKLPKDILFKGFTVEPTNINGFEIETAVDADGNFRLFYLQAPESDELVPYLYDEELDEFEKLKYTIKNDRVYIFCDFPEDFTPGDTQYDSNIDIDGNLVKCYSDTNSEMADFHYVYCYSNGVFSVYRFDKLENTLQRQPNVDFSATIEKEDNDNFFARFTSLSTNAKIILIGMLVIVLGVLALLILFIAYLVRRSAIKEDDLLLPINESYFDDIEIQSSEENVK